MLRTLGFTTVYDLGGGIVQWDGEIAGGSRVADSGCTVGLGVAGDVRVLHRLVTQLPSDGACGRQAHRGVRGHGRDPPMNVDSDAEASELASSIPCSVRADLRVRERRRYHRRDVVGEVAEGELRAALDRIK